MRKYRRRLTRLRLPVWRRNQPATIPIIQALIATAYTVIGAFDSNLSSVPILNGRPA
jgi:hypothetical protein